MEFLELLIIVNLGSVLFIAITLYQSYKYRDGMTPSAHHHLISHGYLVLFFGLAINVFYFEGYITPLVFVFLYTLQHVGKENRRLVLTDRWTPTVEDEGERCQ